MDLFDYDNKRRSGGSPIVLRIFSFIIKIAILAGLVYFSYTYMLLSHVPTGSMEQTIIPGDYVVGYKAAYAKKDPRVGDIVLFTKNNSFMCKRIVGVAGDTITFEDGYLYRNGERLHEKYIAADVETNSPKIFNVPEGSCFLLGDNREASYDSRYWDEPYVSYKDLEAKVLVVVPFHLVLPVH